MAPQSPISSAGVSSRLIAGAVWLLVLAVVAYNVGGASAALLVVRAGRTRLGHLGETGGLGRAATHIRCDLVRHFALRAALAPPARISFEQRTARTALCSNNGGSRHEH